MFRGLLTKAQFWLKRARSLRTYTTRIPAAVLALPASRRLTRVHVAAGVMHTLFEDYAEHRDGPRGDEEIGWILLGLWEDGEATALAALPAGAERDASAGHVRFNTDAQALASRIVRQKDKRLRVLGVVHTHPGDMRYPSNGDLLGDSRWVAQLRPSEAIFGIGTADGSRGDAEDASVHGELCFSWYSLAAGDQCYRPLPVNLVEGADLARSLRPLWDTVEAYASPLNRLCRQLTNIHFDSINDGGRVLLTVQISLAEPNQRLRLLLTEGEARYYWDRSGKLTAIDPQEPQLDRAVYLILAELAKESAEHENESRRPVETGL